MAERNIYLSPFDSEKPKLSAQTQSLEDVTKEYGPIKPYNYNCQLDQYNVKLCGVIFDAIGGPDFILRNDNVESKINTIE
ncbi:unnamed protein product (macronuclear) [Paramecium tetraurelia]|uniref:Uncharacterized protein n=1 Tax=Paramecium tetraurelia TaxID=5888 RepID=A0CBQ6_PARTE|nr:uncharacterized protein GSPATT00037006001 [Paramecium tetraurelia]CAK68223.1 unnamed protein product [Paramecium tetraurelia]|eukprot:XP_001435620.1 hypothetical protein (macronuclear) [Paramecium tetraurelia strain d4-2]